ncbi:MAG: type IV pilin protein [Gammaproteobacteria bacterium]
MRNANRNLGFSLIELMVVVLLMSIIMGIGIPSYRQYTQRAARADATAALLRLAAAQERWYLQNGTYATNAQLQAPPPGGLGFTGAKTERQFYDLQITAANALAFTVQATPAAGQPQITDADCQAFTMDERGTRTSAPQGINVCWR